MTGGRLAEPELRRVGMSIVGQCFLYRAAGQVVGMLVPQPEIETLHSPSALADHVTSFALAALGAASPLAAAGPFRKDSPA